MIARILIGIRLRKKSSQAKRSTDKLQRRINNLEEHVYEYRELDRLDFALLNLSSILGLMFSIFISIVIFTRGGGLWLLIFLPALIIGWIVPFHLWRTGGAFSPLSERMRGWAYFITSVAFYSFITLFMIIDRFARSLFQYPVSDTLAIIGAVISLIILIHLGNLIFAKKIYLHFRTYGYNFTPQVKEKILKTIYSGLINYALFLSSFMIFYLGCLFYQIREFVPVLEIPGILFSLFGIILFFYSIALLKSIERDIKLQKKGKSVRIGHIYKGW